MPSGLGYMDYSVIMKTIAIANPLHAKSVKADTVGAGF